jgi:hypothetical protein
MARLEDFPAFMREGLRENGFRAGCNWSRREILDAWLQWEGIIGFTEQILQAVESATDHGYHRRSQRVEAKDAPIA